MTSKDRRDFLKLSATALAAAGATSMLPPIIRKALAETALPGAKSGSLADIEHVIILMQENRSFDHYFGMLPGVRGFADPHPAPLPNGLDVWHQPNLPNKGIFTSSGAAKSLSGRVVDTVMPYPLHPASPVNVNYQQVGLDHSWKGSQQTWENWSAWVQKKGYRTMGYLKRADLPFYYALADAFTVCDAYHCSVFGPTNPNRRYLWTGTSGAGKVNSPHKHYIVQNDELWESNETSEKANDHGYQNGWNWQTYADVLQNNGIDWWVYQGYRNFGDNALAYFNNFRRGGSNEEKIKRARSWDFSDSGDHFEGGDEVSVVQLLNKLKADLKQKDDKGTSKFPAVSWIVPPKKYSEHPYENTSSNGEWFTKQVIEAVIGQKDIWDKCAIFITYDENDGYFDHVPAPIPPLDGYGDGYGKHNLKKADGKAIDLSDETFAPDYAAREPIGLGPRVPMIVVSPWSKGGRVSSRLSDHTSVLQFLETWLVAKGHKADKVRCNNISDWRRAVCGDLTETLNFTSPSKLPSDAEATKSEAEPDNGKGTYAPYPYSDGDLFVPDVPKGDRPACPLPYNCKVTGSKVGKSITMTFDNSKSTAAATFIAYLDPLTTAQKALHYTVAAGTVLTDTRTLSTDNGVHVLGPKSPEKYFWKL